MSNKVNNFKKTHAINSAFVNFYRYLRIYGGCT